MGCLVYKRLMILIIRIPSPLDDLDFVEIKIRATTQQTFLVQRKYKIRRSTVKISSEDRSRTEEKNSTGER